MTPADPVLPPETTRRLTGVVPVNMHLDVQWQAIRTARDIAKRAKLDCSPSLMIAWCTSRAMLRHPAFACTVQDDGKIVEKPDFDLGVAVALDGDRQATAAIPQANRLDWRGFLAAYADAVARTRAGKVAEVQTSLILTSLGAFGIEKAIPIVVPPAMGTLFVGQAHLRMIGDGGVVSPVEVVTLSLTFDHRVVNGVGAAAFLHDVKVQIEGFALPG